MNPTYKDVNNIQATENIKILENVIRLDTNHTSRLGHETFVP